MTNESTRLSSRIVLSIMALAIMTVVALSGRAGLASALFDVQATESPTPTPYVTCLVTGVPPTAPSPLCRTVTPTPAGSQSSQPSASPTPTTSPSKPGKSEELRVSNIALEFKKAIHRFSGSVGSDAKICLIARDVIIYKDKSGIDPIVAKIKTTDTGRYSVAPKRVEGRYYATVEESKAGKYGRMFTCGGAQSKVIKTQ